MKVTNLTSNNGTTVPNQFEIRDDEGNTYFQSYNSIIVKWTKDNKIYLDVNKWDYSKTTSKYRNIFLGETTKEIEKKIKSGEYILTELN